MYSSTFPQNPGAAASFGISAEDPVEKSISSYLTKLDLSQNLYPIASTKKNGMGRYVVANDDALK